jgi:hypothetical protein
MLVVGLVSFPAMGIQTTVLLKFKKRPLKNEVFILTIVLAVQSIPSMSRVSALLVS